MRAPPAIAVGSPSALCASDETALAPMSAKAAITTEKRHKDRIVKVLCILRCPVDEVFEPSSSSAPTARNPIAERNSIRHRT